MASILISTNDTAKLLRQALKQTFPGTKFSVRSNKYSGGSSLNVRYEDGPSYSDVDKVAQQFAGATFDGMQDLKEYTTHINEKGEAVQYGPDFVFVNRDYSNAAFSCAVKYTLETQHLTVWQDGELVDWNGEGDYSKQNVMIGHTRQYVGAYAQRVLSDMDLS